MPLSRDRLEWQAPTENIDGTAIDYDLDYELGLTTTAGGPLVATTTFPGTLNPDGTYYADLTSMVFPIGDLELGLRVINRDDPTRVSDWSNRLPLVVTGAPPRPPVLLDR